ncbi:hypothetical protein TeGR_g5388, partial [Tetraparma gracilis]
MSDSIGASDGASGISSERNVVDTSSNRSTGGAGGCFVLVPVQDDKSDQSNSAPKRILLPAGSTHILGRNPLTGIMDALVSRGVMSVESLEAPGDDGSGGKVKLSACKVPNKLTLNGNKAFKDDISSQMGKVGDMISLYDIKYRYTIAWDESVSNEEAKSTNKAAVAAAPPASSSAKVAPESPMSPKSPKNGERSTRRQSTSGQMIAASASSLKKKMNESQNNACGCNQMIAWAAF